jgi:hypothetical protein
MISPGMFATFSFLAAYYSQDMAKPLAKIALGNGVCTLMRSRATFVIPNMETGFPDLSKVPVEELTPCKTIGEWQAVLSKHGVLRLDE